MAEQTAIVPAGNRTLITTMAEAERAATAMATSGYFADSRTAAQAVVKILAGQEMGFGPFASMNGVYIIQGRPSIGANLMAAAVKKSGRYNYRIVEMTDAVCEVAFFEGGQEIGRSRFTADDARKAGTKNMDKYPRNMLFARAMSNGVRWYCPDVFNGNTVYTPEELGAEVNEDGEVINGHFTEPPPAATGTNGKQAAPPADDGGYDPDKFNYPAGRQYAKLGKYQWPAAWYPAVRKDYPKAAPQEVEGILLALNITPENNNDMAIGAVCAWLSAKANGADEKARKVAACDYIAAVLDGRSENG